MIARQATRKTHDADLCDRLRALEDRIKELEARPTYAPVHYCYYGCSHWPQFRWTTGTTWSPPPNTTITYGSSDSAGVITASEVS